MTNAHGTGGAVHMRPTDIPGVGRFAFVADPQGVLVYVMRGDHPHPSRAFEPTTPGHGGWNKLLTQDWQAAFDFYADQFGWTKADALDLGPMGTLPADRSCWHNDRSDDETTFGIPPRGLMREATATAARDAGQPVGRNVN